MDPSFKDFKLHDLSPFLITSSLSSAQRWRNSPPFERFFAGRDGCLQFVRAASSFVDRCCCSRPVFLKDYPRRRRLTRALPLPRIFQPEKVTDLDRACGAGHTESILPSNSHGVVTVSSSNLLETPWPRYATPVEEGGALSSKRNRKSWMGYGTAHWIIRETLAMPGMRGPLHPFYYGFFHASFVNKEKREWMINGVSWNLVFFVNAF